MHNQNITQRIAYAKKVMARETAKSLMISTGFLLLIVGLLGYCKQHVIPQMLDVLLLEKWPQLPRLMYAICHWST